jgi:hypothetical protein
MVQMWYFMGFRLRAAGCLAAWDWWALVTKLPALRSG